MSSRLITDCFPLSPISSPKLGAYLLQPLFVYGQSGMYPNKWSVHDMGANYPKAIGHNDGKDEARKGERRDSPRGLI